jgi:hypothetical protein
MTFAINIETKYRIPVILNNEKKLFQGTIKQLQGTLQAVPITRISTIIPFIGNNTKNKNHKETGNNRRNTNQKEECKNTTYREQYKNKTYSEQ